MRSFTLLSVVLVAVLVVLQWGGESNAIPPPLPVYQQPQPYYAYNPQTPIVPGPTYIPTPSVLPGEYEGVSDQSAIVGDGNIDFTGVSVVDNLNIPINALSITDSVGGLGALGLL